MISSAAAVVSSSFPSSISSSFSSSFPSSISSSSPSSFPSSISSSFSSSFPSSISSSSPSSFPSSISSSFSSSFPSSISSSSPSSFPSSISSSFSSSFPSSISSSSPSSFPSSISSSSPSSFPSSISSSFSSSFPSSISSSSSFPSSISSSSSFSSSISSPSSSSIRFRHICPICAGPSNGFFFGVPSCRACASFFRRSALERRKFICRREGKCSLISKIGMRNSCRACRLRRCIEAGMSLARTTDSTNDSQMTSICKWESDRPKGNSDQHQQKKEEFSLNLSVNLCCPNVERFLCSMRNIENGVKAVVNVLNIDEGNGILITDQKIEIVRNFALNLHFFRVAELTLRAFPNRAQFDSLVIHWGCMIVKNRMDQFFATAGNVKERIRMAELFWDIWHSFVSDYFHPLAPDRMEIGALIGILFWNCIERVLPHRAEPSLQRNALFVELHALVSRQCVAAVGTNSQENVAAEIATRLGKMYALLQEAVVMSWKIEEAMTMCKVFLPPLYKCWENLADFLDGKEMKKE